MCPSQEDNFGGDIAISFVKASRDGAGNEEQDKPRDSHFIKHLEVQDTNARIQFRAHEEIINGRA
jgi:hypothetical protein